MININQGQKLPSFTNILITFPPSATFNKIPKDGLFTINDIVPKYRLFPDAITQEITFVFDNIELESGKYIIKQIKKINNISIDDTSFEIKKKSTHILERIAPSVEVVEVKPELTVKSDAQNSLEEIITKNNSRNKPKEEQLNTPTERIFSNITNTNEIIIDFKDEITSIDFNKIQLMTKTGLISNDKYQFTSVSLTQIKLVLIDLDDKHDIFIGITLLPGSINNSHKSIIFAVMLHARVDYYHYFLEYINNYYQITIGERQKFMMYYILDRIDKSYDVSSLPVDKMYNCLICVIIAKDSPFKSDSVEEGPDLSGYDRYLSSASIGPLAAKWGVTRQVGIRNSLVTASYNKFYEECFLELDVSDASNIWLVNSSLSDIQLFDEGMDHYHEPTHYRKEVPKKTGGNNEFKARS